MDLNFIGPGIMGSRLAADLQKRGRSLAMHNRSREKAPLLLAIGAQRTDSLAALVAQEELLSTILTPPDAEKNSALGRDGLLVHFARRLRTDCSSVNPSFSIVKIHN